jgi:hypothetical protein
MRRWILALVPIALPSPAVAQDAYELDRIEVTGSRISYDDLETPAIAITRKGDYLLQELRLVSDSRDAEVRKRELHETIAAMIAAADGRYELLHGDTYRIVLERSNHRIELEEGEDEERPDTSHATVFLRAKLGGQATGAEATIQSMREFALAARRIGRAEIDLEGETALGMNRPERYRYELIDAIARDAQQVTGAMRLDCRISLDGLNSRLEWERVSAAELLLYIPYTMTITDCTQRAPTP